MEITYNLIIKYPWLPSLKKFRVDLANIKPIEFIKEILVDPSNIELLDRIYEFFKAAFANLEDFSYYMEDLMNIYMYLALRIIIYLLNDKRITNRVANLYSKITGAELLREINRKNFFDLFQICKDLKLKIEYQQKEMVFGVTLVNIQKETKKTNFRIYFTDYLKMSSDLKDESKKLLYNPLQKGFIFILPERLARLIQEYVRNKFLNQENEDKKSIEDLKNKALNIEPFKELFNNILSDWELKKEEFEYFFEVGFRKDSDLSKHFPPCILEILTKANEGQNLIHTERLYVVWFLIALDYPIEEIINIFTTLPDFDRDATKYQVEYAKKKAYTPYSCKTLKSLQLCMAAKYEDNLCMNGYYSYRLETQKEITHPLFYLQYKQFRESKEQNNKQIAE